MTVAQSAKETEAEGLRCAQPEGEASNMRASEDILERAKTSLKRHDPINQGFYTSMPPEDVQIWKELIAEVEAKNDKIVQDAITIQMHHNNVLALQKDVERLRSNNTILQAEIDRLRWDVLCDVENEVSKRDARIKKLEAEKRRLEARVEYCHDQTQLIERLKAAFLKAKRCPTCNGKGVIRDPYLSRVRGLIIDESIDRICTMCEGKGEEKAREALERIKEGGKNEGA